MLPGRLPSIQHTLGAQDKLEESVASHLIAWRKEDLLDLGSHQNLPPAPVAELSSGNCPYLTSLQTTGFPEPTKNTQVKGKRDPRMIYWAVRFQGSRASKWLTLSPNAGVRFACAECWLCRTPVYPQAWAPTSVLRGAASPLSSSPSLDLFTSLTDCLKAAASFSTCLPTCPVPTPSHKAGNRLTPLPFLRERILSLLCLKPTSPE